MNIKSTYIKLYRFLTTDIWSIRHNEVSPIRFFMYTVLKKLILAVEFTTTKRITSSAAALTYSTLLAIVPILAVVFAIARGFGYNKYIEAWFRESLSSQPQAAETIIGFVNSYLVHTKSGLFLGIGLIFMLFTVIMLVSNIEQTFNYIWQVKKPRSVFRTITDYTSMFLLVPLVIVITSGISIFFATIFQQIEDTMLLGPIMQFFLQLMPYGHNVGRVCSIVCVHAKYQSKDRMCSCAWYSCRCSNARTTVVLYPLTDMGKQLQCHLWIVCRFAYVHVMGADIMADMSLRSRIVLCKSKHGRLCLQN